MLRGSVIVDDGSWVGGAGGGRLLERGRNALMAGHR
jgi:hypothetical protein